MLGPTVKNSLSYLTLKLNQNGLLLLPSNVSQYINVMLLMLFIL